MPGYAYQRDGHPNADVLAEKCRQFHRADHATMTSSGQAAVSLALLSFLSAGDHVLLSSRLYGNTVRLFRDQAARFGITASETDVLDLEKVSNTMTGQTRMLVVETISNPTLRICDIAELARLAHQRNAKLLVDNTFASPVVCRPLELGADLVVESLTKIMNGHSDSVMGLLCGAGDDGQRINRTVRCWGMTSSPFDCWICERGLMTLHVRVSAACKTAMGVAQSLVGHPAIRQVDYPGLSTHPDHGLASRQFHGADHPMFGHIVTIHLKGGAQAAGKLIGGGGEFEIPYCTSLGGAETTLSHPCSSSHRSCTRQEQVAVGIDGGTIRLSIGLESPEYVVKSLVEGLHRLD